MVKEPPANASSLMARFVPLRVLSQQKCNDAALQRFLPRNYSESNIQLIRAVKTRYTNTRTSHVS
jgi:hypothetical protein